MLTRRICILLLACATFAASLASAQSPSIAKLELPSVISTGCVLQRNSRVPLWGQGQPGHNVIVEVSWSGKVYSGQVRPDGNWWVPVPTPDAGGPYEIGIHSGTTKVLIEDVLIGEVWVCSGQSNMEMPIAYRDASYTGVQDAAEEIANAKYPEIRLFTVERGVALEPQPSCPGSWEACSPETVAQFSATSYFFGRELHRELGVPIGLISSAFGGSRAEAWMSAQAFSKRPGFEQVGSSLLGSASNDNALVEAQAAAVSEWSLEVERRDSFAQREWQAPEAAEESDEWRGLLWIRYEVEVDSNAHVALPAQRWGEGSIWFAAYVNGTLVGRNKFTEPMVGAPHSVEVPPELFRTGKNEVVIAMLASSDGPTVRRVRSLYELDSTTENESTLSVESTNWKFARGLDMHDFPSFPDYRNLDNHTPTGLFNAMIAPIMPYSMRGVIWYQGESNIDREEQYEALFAALVADWRGWWRQGNFPFYSTQIAPYEYDTDRGRPAALRAAQRDSLAIPNTGMAVTMDIGNSDDIHPKNKQEVGRRLALWALAKDYGREDLVYSGPLDASLEVAGDALTIHFEHVGGGLVAAEGGLRHFELAGADGVFHEAEAKIDGEVVVVRSAGVAEPKSVRYCGGTADVGTLFNREGLPAPSFTRDDS